MISEIFETSPGCEIVNVREVQQAEKLFLRPGQTQSDLQTGGDQKDSQIPLTNLICVREANGNLLCMDPTRVITSTNVNL
jgi:hypothetical protein